MEQDIHVAKYRNGTIIRGKDISIHSTEQLQFSAKYTLKAAKTKEITPIPTQIMCIFNDMSAMTLKPERKYARGGQHAVTRI